MASKAKSASLKKNKGKAGLVVKPAAKVKSTRAEKAALVKVAPVRNATKSKTSSRVGEVPSKKATPATKKKPAQSAPVKKAPAAKKEAKKEKEKKEPAAKAAPTAKTTSRPAKPNAGGLDAKPQPSQPGKAAEGTAVNLAKESERRKKVKATLAKLRSEPDWKQFLAEQKKALIQMRDELLPNMHSVTRDHLRSGESNVSSSSGQHIGDAGSEAEQRDITILRLDKDREQLFEIEAALDRIAKGTYGVCELSLDPIPRKRLQARPFCRFTVKCQEEYEKRYGAFSALRSKNSGDVGFSGLQKVIESTILLDDDEE